MLRQLTSLTGIVAVAGLAAWPFVQTVPKPVTEVSESRPLQTGDELKLCVVDRPGNLVISLYGSLQEDIDVRGPELLCTGKLDRLSGRSRLAFSTEQTDLDNNIVVVIGLEEVTENSTQNGLPTNLTILDQDSGIFFGTQGFGRCWTDLAQTPAIGNPTTEKEAGNYYTASGEVYCAGAIPQIQGPGSLTVSKLQFSGNLIVNEVEPRPETGPL
jgi:hypothetical protein